MTTIVPVGGTVSAPRPQATARPVPETHALYPALLDFDGNLYDRDIEVDEVAWVPLDELGTELWKSDGTAGGKR